MTNTERFQKAIEILKAAGVKGIGRIRGYISETNKNNVEIVTEAGPYCVVNIKTGRIVDC